MRIVIDHDLCQGMGECRALVPDLIVFDTLGIASVAPDAPAVDAETARRLVAICPSTAITIAPG